MKPFEITAAAVAICAIGPLTTKSAIGREDPFADSDLVALSDGAMVATGYVDGLLGALEPDLLTVLRHGDDGTWARADVGVSNSVATWPNVLAVTSDGRTAIATEPFAQPDDEATELSEVEQGSALTVVDLSDRANPTIRQTIEVAGQPTAVDIHPSGTAVAVAYAAEGRVAIYPFEDGKLGEPIVSDLGLEDVTNTFVPEVKWHPSGDFAAVTLGGAARVAFYRYAENRLEPWGAPIATAPLPGKGQWTSDGRHFLVTTINIAGGLAQLGYGRNTSLLTVVRFDDDEERNSPPRRANDRTPIYTSEPIQHSIVATAPSGMGYVENFAISPDGTHVIGLNMVASWLPTDHPGYTNYSELTTLAFDPSTGSLEAGGSTRLPGVTLPQGIVFDQTGEHVAVTSFQDPDAGPGRLQFWSFTPDADEPFAPVGDEIPMPRGVHLVTTLAR